MSHRAETSVKRLILFLAFCTISDFVQALCDVCQRNGAVCVNSTSYHLCFGDNTPNTDILYHCPTALICTDLNAICVQAQGSRQPSCADTTSCGNCNAQHNNQFACISRSTFQLCYGNSQPFPDVGYCPAGYVCDANSDDFCVREDLAKVTCNIPDPSTTTTSTTNPGTDDDVTTVSTTTWVPLTPDDVCESVKEIGLFPMPGDIFCKRYVYCSYNNSGIIKGIEYICSNDSFYDIDRRACTLTKPSYCI